MNSRGNKWMAEWLEGLGRLTLLAKESVASLLTIQITWRDLLYQVYFTGVKSQSVVLITGAFTGMVLGAQTYFQFHKVKMDTATLAVVSITMCSELGPVLTGLMVAGRVGAAIAAEGSPATLVAGGIKFRGRAADRLTEGLPRRSWADLTRCPHEDLRYPKRIHVDCHGHLHLCQGLCMGNCFERPLARILGEYDAEAHPIAGPLDECHMCYRLRQTLLEQFGQYLAPR